MNIFIKNIQTDACVIIYIPVHYLNGNITDQMYKTHLIILLVIYFFTAYYHRKEDEFNVQPNYFLKELKLV